MQLELIVTVDDGVGTSGEGWDDRGRNRGTHNARFHNAVMTWIAHASAAGDLDRTRSRSLTDAYNIMTLAFLCGRFSF